MIGHMDAETAKRLVREGYNEVSHLYRGDTLPEGGGYAEWVRDVTRGLNEGDPVLDLGCGNGIPVSQWLSSRFNVTGVDISDVQIERARALVPTATLHRADMTRIRFEPATFAAIVSLFALIHVPVAEQAGLIRRMATWLRPEVGSWRPSATKPGPASSKTGMAARCIGVRLTLQHMLNGLTRRASQFSGRRSSPRGTLATPSSPRFCVVGRASARSRTRPARSSPTSPPRLSQRYRRGLARFMSSPAQLIASCTTRRRPHIASCASSSRVNRSASLPTPPAIQRLRELLLALVSTF